MPDQIVSRPFTSRPPTEKEWRQFLAELANPPPPMPTVPHQEGFQMFAPVAKSHRTDDDCAVVCWERGRKMVTMYLNCYGSEPQIKVGLCNPPGGMVAGLSLAEAWEWFCNYAKTTLPEAPKQ